MRITELYQIFLQHPSVQTDTRKLRPGDLFFALKGERFDGNGFAAQALQAGASFAVIDDPAFQQGKQTILVENALHTLQQLALEHRRHFQIPFLAITGSNGKTTTKELVHAVLSSHFITYTTEGNLNNQIGIPLTLLKIKSDAQIAVVEMGANHQREIAAYCQYTLPTHGLITNCGKAHLEGFGGVEGVRKGKGELYDYLRNREGTAFVMWDYDYLREMSRGIPHIIRYGTRDATTVTGHLLKCEPFLELMLAEDGGNRTLRTRLVGEYNLPNVLAAVTIGRYFGVPEEKMIRAIENYAPSNSRSQLLEKGTHRIILDAYNANPSSMRLAIENFAKQPGDNKILVLGAMAELGEESKAEHQAIIDLISQHTWKEVLLVGGDFQQIGHPYQKFDSSLSAGEWLKTRNYSDCHFLLKGSRSMQMEKVLDTIN